MNKTIIFLSLFYFCFHAMSAEKNKKFTSKNGISFIENKGQFKTTDESALPSARILYKGSSNGVDYYILEDRISFVFKKKSAGEKVQDVYENPQKFAVAEMYRVDMKLSGGNEFRNIIPAEPSYQKLHYYINNEVRAENLKKYSKLVIKNVYEKIDMVLYENEGTMEYDFLVHPGGDASAIKMKFSGAVGIAISADGNLKISTPLGYITEGKPVTYQLGSNQSIPSVFRFLSKDEVGFALGNYDHTKEIIIDPKRIWATYYGDTDDDITYFLKGNKKDALYVVGYSASTNFPVSIGAYQSSHGGGTYDGLVAKFDTSGNVIWCTYIGGSDDDFVYSIDEYNNKFIVVSGRTNSTNYPTSSSAYQSSNAGGFDGLITRFDTSGKMQFSTYLGDKDDENQTLICDKTGNVYITGQSNSSSLPVTTKAFQTTNAGGVDIYAAKFDSSGNLKWLSYYGGSSDDFNTFPAITNDNKIIVVGISSSSNFPVTTGSYQTSNKGGKDAIYMKLDTSGSLLYSTYFGGSGDDDFHNAATDANNNVYIGGYSTSSSNVATSGAYQKTNKGGTDGIMVKFSSGNTLQWATYFGGNGFDILHRLSLDVTGNPFSTLQTTSTNIAVTSDAFQKSNNGGNDGGFVKFSSDGKLIYATYFGGNGDDNMHGIETDYSGNFYFAGFTKSTNFPVTSSAIQSTSGGNIDWFLGRFFDKAPSATISGNASVCLGDSVRLIVALLPSTKSVIWSNGKTTDTIYVKKSGKYSATLKLGSGTTIYSDTVNVTINPAPIARFSYSGLCANSKISFNDSSSGVNGVSSWAWSFGDGNTSSSANPNNVYTAGGKYQIKLIVKDTKGCSDSAVRQITITQPIAPVITTTGGKTSFCEHDSLLLDAGTGYSKYLWNNNMGTQSIYVKDSGFYKVTVTDNNGCQVTSALVTIKVNPASFNVSFSTDKRVITTKPFTVAFTNGTPSPAKYSYTWLFGDGNTSTNESPIYTYTANGLYTVTLRVQNKSTGCKDSMVKVDWISCNLVGIEENMKHAEFSLIPNPAREKFVINISGDNEKYFLTVTDILGREVFNSEKIMSNLPAEIIMGNQPKGVYIVKIFNGKKSSSQKLILE